MQLGWSVVVIQSVSRSVVYCSDTFASLLCSYLQENFSFRNLILVVNKKNKKKVKDESNFGDNSSSKFNEIY